jgi:dihydrofolate synthase / folylpolyglutamate synthase
MTSPRFNGLAQWLAWQETLHPNPIDLGLERVSAVAQRLDASLNGRLLANPAKKFLVAGTNGKGSCVSSLCALLAAQGLRVGTYTSPHLIEYQERIVLAGQTVEPGQLCAAFAAIDQARGEISLTYFEFGTLAAYWLFAQAELDIWVIEVGLGGRLDATNLLSADCAIVTSIALDHEAWLGSTREAIAREKFAIARPGGLFICADPAPPSNAQALVAELGCRAFWSGEDFTASRDEGLLQLSIPALGWQCTLSRWRLPPPSMIAALAALAQLGYLPSPVLAVEVLSGLGLAGRGQEFALEAQEFVLDVAHNPAATAYLAQELARRQKPYCLVMAMMADKDLVGSLAPLAAAQRAFFAALPSNPRAASPEDLVTVAGSLGISASASGSVSDALALAMAFAQQASERPLIVVCGSFFTLAEAYPWLEAHAAREITHE